ASSTAAAASVCCRPTSCPTSIPSSSTAGSSAAAAEATSCWSWPTTAWAPTSRSSPPACTRRHISTVPAPTSSSSTASAMRCYGKPGTVIVPPDGWFHEHFNTGSQPARYLALRYGGVRHRQPMAISIGEGSDVNVKEGGWQIEYEDEDPSVHRIFESELAKHNAVCRMKGLVPSCTGLPPEDAGED